MTTPKSKSKVVCIKAQFCNSKCKTDFKKWKKKEKKARNFALICALQNRCAFCGDRVKKDKKIRIVG